MREDDYIYVDKTKWIERLLTTNKAYFFSRPRRFGKSLTISTLKELFKGEKELFKDLYIYDKWDFVEYPVIVFDFNRIMNKNSDILEKALLDSVYKNGLNYGIEINYNLSSSAFSDLVVKLYQKFNQKVVILIDEYDKPMIDHLGKGAEHIKIANQNRDVLKSFFGVVKSNEVVDVLKFVFVTGVSRFVKVSIFSEWNNLSDISGEPEYAGFLGYSEDEIIQNFKPYLEELYIKYNFNKDECLAEIKRWYNGYRFSIYSDLKVYNPISLMSAFDKKRFDNYWFKTATPSFLVNLLKEQNYYLPKLENVEIKENFLEVFDIENLAIVPLLFQTGYLTITDYEDGFVTLNYPNIEVKNSFNDILLNFYYSPQTEIFLLARDLGKAFRDENFDEIQPLLNETLSQIPYPIHNKNENYYHSIVYMILSVLGLKTTSEVINSKGRLDMKIEFGDKIFLIEFKANQNATIAINQIKNKYLISYKSSIKKIYLCGINFDIEKREVDEVLVENQK